MTELSALIQNEYKNISFNMEAAQVVLMYNKQRRKKVTLFAGSALCVIMAISVFFQVNPKAFESFVFSTREFFNSLFSGYSTIGTTQPTTIPSKPAVTAADIDETESLDSEPEIKEKRKTQSYNSTEPTEPTQNGFTPAETSPDSEKETQATEKPTEKPAETQPTTSGVNSKILDTAKIKYIKVSSKTIRITKCIPTNNRMVIPEVIDGYTVTEIGEGILKGYNSVYEVVLPDTITKIRDKAFMGLYALESINIPKSIKSIGASAFEDCTAIESINLYSVESIGAAAFMGCESITEITIPETAKTVGTKAFYDCSGLESAVIGSNCDDGNDEADNFTFSGCDSLKSVSFLNGVTSTCPYQFYQCQALKTVELPQTIKEAGQSSFSCCTALKKVDLPEGLEKISQRAFYKCRSFVEINLPESLKSIYKEAFYACKDVAVVTVPKSVTVMGAMCLGYTYNDDKISGFTIRGYENTTAKTYAKNNGFKFESLGGAPNPTTVTLENYIVILDAGSTYTIKYSVENPNGETTFKSSDVSVAEVSSSGIVTAKKSGKATIDVTNNGATRQLVVIVQ